MQWSADDQVFILLPQVQFPRLHVDPLAIQQHLVPQRLQYSSTKPPLQVTTPPAVQSPAVEPSTVLPARASATRAESSPLSYKEQLKGMTAQEMQDEVKWQMWRIEKAIIKVSSNRALVHPWTGASECGNSVDYNITDH